MVTLTELFKAHQEQMQAFLNKKMLHAVEQGDNSENAWLEFFSKYLPARYCCDKGHVIDSRTWWKRQRCNWKRLYRKEHDLKDCSEYQNKL